MKRLDILVCLELFNIRKCKNYPKQIIKDSYVVVRDICRKNTFDNLFCFESNKGISNYREFKDALRTHYLQKSPLEYRYCKELLSYMDSFDAFVTDSF